MEDNIYTTLSMYLKNFISSASYEAVYSETDRAIIELVDELIRTGIDPQKFVSQASLLRFKEIIGIDLTALDDSSDIQSEPQQDQVLKINHKEIFCSNFSVSKDLSESYQFANPVPQHTCSHSEVKNHVCVISTRQDRCPYYTPDFQHFATYTLVDNDSVFYKVYKHRATNGYTVYTIYDNNENLVHNLSYDANTVYDHTKQDFNSELESIVYQNYSYISSNPKFSYVYHNQKSEAVENKPKSYIATLVTVS